MKNSKFSLDFDQEVDQNKQINKQELESFMKGASTHSTNFIETKIWSNEDPYEEPSYTTSLRLNTYEMKLLKEAARQEGRSMNRLIRKILVKELKNIVS